MQKAVGVPREDPRIQDGIAKVIWKCVTEAGYERIGGTQGNARERNDHQEGFAYRRSAKRAETVFESFACGQQGLQGPQQRSVLQRLPRSLIGRRHPIARRQIRD